MLRQRLEVGDTCRQRLVDALERRHVAQYAGASGDFSLVHVDDPFAKSAGYPTLLAHGMLTMGLTGTLLTSLVGHRGVRRFSGRLLAPVFIGDRLGCAATVRESVVGGERMAVIDLETVRGSAEPVFRGIASVVQIEDG